MITKILSKAKKIALGFSSAGYWNKRYQTGGDSGSGSYGKFAEFKAQTLNSFIAKHKVSSVIEFGCGDGNQLGLFAIPRYTGVDVSSKAIDLCREKYAADESKGFILASDYRGESADMSMSLDVIYHLVENRVYIQYMDNLFKAGTKYVVIYSSDTEKLAGYGRYKHVKHRNFTKLVSERYPNYTLIEIVNNPYPWNAETNEGSFANFYFFQRNV